jgi:DNA-binding SARP family transcriptional activator/tetratricopeptide (TPR) repeat protein
MEFRILGPLEVLVDGRALELGGAKQRALLAILLLNANRVVSIERLIDALWDEEPTATAQKALQVYVSQLRKLVARERLQTKAPGYVLQVEPEELDLARFERLREQGRFREALGLWRGPPLAEFAQQRFAQNEIARLDELRLACLEERVERDLAAGRHAELVAELEALVKQHPLRERLRGQLMLALYRSGRQAEALEVYRNGRCALVDELGLEPGRALQELEGAILRRDPVLEAPPAATTGPAAPREQLQPAVPVGTVTFLFTDIEGSTALVERLRDAYGALRAEHQGLLRAAFAEYGGYEIDTQGDAFFVAFGRARDAVSAAVAGQRSLSEHRWPDGAELRVRMGIHTDEPSVAEEGYHGLGVIRAARICAAGHGGQVLVSDATGQLIGHDEQFALRDLGEHRLKGLNRPERIFQLLAQGLPEQFPPLRTVEASALPLAGRAEEQARSAFVGRGAELEELLAGLEDALAGRGRLFLVSGEPGIGKSRLADELIRHARTRGAQVLVGRSWEAGGAPAYWPWVQSLRAYIREAEAEELQAQLGAGAGDLAQILPELRELLPGLAEPPALEADAARFRLFDATAEFLGRASARRPILLVLDDLHAADTPSLLLLRFLAREVVKARMLVLAAFRDVDPLPGEPLTELLGEVAREPGARRLSLGGLSERDVEEYVELTAAELAVPELVAELYEETDGNPLFVGEMVRLLALEGAGAEVRLAIPQSVQDVIARRLTHLSDACNRTLVFASILGREFALDALAGIAGVSEDDLLETLDEAMIARVVSDLPGASGRLRFAHVLIRDTLYEGLTTARRVRLHRSAVASLEALYGEESGPHLAELAHHAIAGSEFDKGTTYARRAGDRALTLLAYEEAARLYTTALEALEVVDPAGEQTRCELLLSLGEAQIRAGDSLVAKETFVRAADIARKRGLSRELARAAAGYGGRIVWGRAGGDEQLVPLIDEALAALGRADVELRARLLARLAGALRDEHSRERRDRLTSEGVELARRSGNPAALAYALAGRAHAIIAPDTVAECLALATELCEVATRSGDKERLQAGHQLRIVAELMLGDFQGAEEDVAAASRVAEELRQPAQLWDACAARAMMALASGRFAEAEELIPQALALGERALPLGAIPIYHLQRYALSDFRGDVREHESGIEDLAAEYPARPVFRCVFVHLCARLDRLDDARRELEALAADDFSVVPFDQEWLYSMSLLAETSAILGDRGSAGALYGLLAPWATFSAADLAEGFRGSISRYLGLLAATLGRHAEAAAHYEDALAMNEAMGARPWLAHTQRDFAQTLVARDEPGDRERAQELLDAALATYRELGMESYAAKASAPAGKQIAPAT